MILIDEAEITINYDNRSGQWEATVNVDNSSTSALAGLLELAIGRAVIQQLEMSEGELKEALKN